MTCFPGVGTRDRTGKESYSSSAAKRVGNGRDDIITLVRRIARGGFFRRQVVFINRFPFLIFILLVGFALPRVINEVIAVLGVVVVVPSLS